MLDPTPRKGIRDLVSALQLCVPELAFPPLSDSLHFIFHQCSLIGAAQSALGVGRRSNREHRSPTRSTASSSGPSGPPTAPALPASFVHCTAARTPWSGDWTSMKTMESSLRVKLTMTAKGRQMDGGPAWPVTGPDCWEGTETHELVGQKGGSRSCGEEKTSAHDHPLSHLTASKYVPGSSLLSHGGSWR